MKGILVITLVATLVVAISAFPRVQCPEKNGEDVVLLPNPENCTTYYSCANGIAYLMRCNEGLHFNPEERVCDWPEQAGCKSYADLAGDDDQDDDNDDDKDEDESEGGAKEEVSIDEWIPEPSDDNKIRLA